MIVGDGSAPIENATIVVTAGRIAAVGPAGKVTVPAGATRVSLAGKTVMPTILDTHVHLSTTREPLIADLRRRAYFGISAAMSLGLDPPGDPFQVRASPPAGAARYFTAGRGITMPEQGRTDVPYWVTSEAEARKAVQEQAALKVDFIKIWVDDRDGKYQKMPPPIYTAVIDEAHKAKLRVAAHIYNLSDAKGLLKAGIDAFAHGIRDVDVDGELLALVAARPNLVLIPNMPDRGVVADYSWLKGSLPDAEVAKLQAAATDRPQVHATWSIQGRNLKKMADAGVTITVGTDGNTAWAPHVEMEDMVAVGDDAGAGHRLGYRQRRDVPAHVRHRNDRGRQERRPAGARRQPARRHQEHAQDLRGLPARRRRRPRQDAVDLTILRCGDVRSDPAIARPVDLSVDLSIDREIGRSIDQIARSPHRKIARCEAS